ncbi:MAG TPA: protein kinase [Candidatus Dormibacteraeota bacterium]|nr:protein kinase [Candidatus Dormibacteraeota bacterium]
MKYCPSCHKTYPGDYNVCPSDQTGLQSSREFQPGMIIRGKYEILARIGLGGMGAVYRGRHVTFNELCAIKIVNDSIAGDANFLQRFQTEAVITRKLRHPHAVRVDDFDYTEDGRPFIVMELVEGKNVGEVLQAEGPLRVPRAVRIATQAAQALGAAHKLGFVHRDIKPGNIILTTDEQGQETAKVLDFGIAKLRQAAGDAQSGMTMTGMVVGTPLYMSPEQFMGKKSGGEIDGRTDLYSLGVVLYQMVTARLPFEGDTLYSLMMQHMQGTVRPPDELVPELQIPALLSQVILKAIDKSRDLRFQTAEELIAALDQVGNAPTGAVQGIAVPPAAISSVTPTPTARVSQVAPAPATPPPVAPPNVPTPQASLQPSSASVIMAPPEAAPPVPAPIVDPSSTPPLPKSAAQHVFVQQRTFRLRNFLILAALGVAVLLIAGVGYLKYRSLQRLKIENAVVEVLKNAPSPALHASHISVSVLDTGEVILGGNVPSSGDSVAAASLAASVPGVVHVNNQLQVVPPPPPIPAEAESTDSLINKGMAFMDDGNYSAAIDCFTRAANDPNSKSARELLDLARRAQKTEAELLKKRR